MNKILINIKVYKNRYIKPSRNYLGTTGENNATVLRFEFFEKLNGESVSDFQKRLVAILPEGVLKYDLDGDFRLPTELTASEELTLLVEILKGDDILFKSYPHTFNLIDSGDNPETNLIQTAVDSTREACRSELEASLETATGENQDGKTWDELNGTVAELPIISDEQTQALGDYDLIKEYFATYTGVYHDLFRLAPHNADSTERTYRLPYIYTPKMQWRNGNIISSKLLEYGVDVSCATALGVNSGVGPFSTAALQRLVLTGNANAQHLKNFMSAAFELRYIKMETPNETVLKAEPAYYRRAFYTCDKLQTIDCELDFTGQTDTSEMFRNCFLLKDLRFKPFTLSTSIDFGYCRSLHTIGLGDYDSLVSILNGITNDKEVAKNITLTFSEEIRDPRFTTDMSHNEYTIWDKDVYYYTGDNLYHLEIPEVTDGYVYLEIPLQAAFSAKGVTLAWLR